MNMVVLTGRIANDLPNVEELTNRPVLLILAVDKFVAGEKRVDFFPIKVWGKDAENLCKYKSKGEWVNVHSHLINTKYEKNGETIYRLEVCADHVEFVSSSNKNRSNSSIENEENSITEEKSSITEEKSSFTELNTAQKQDNSLNITPNDDDVFNNIYGDSPFFSM